MGGGGRPISQRTTHSSQSVTVIDNFIQKLVEVKVISVVHKHHKYILYIPRETFGGLHDSAFKFNVQ